VIVKIRKRLTSVPWMNLSFAVFPCLGWAFFCRYWVRWRLRFCNTCFLTTHMCYRLWYILFASILLFSLLYCYKRFIKKIYENYGKIFKISYLLFLLFSCVGFFVKCQSRVDILDGVLISPFNEELLAHFSLYKFREYTIKKYLWLALFSSLAFSLMHWGYSIEKLPTVKDMILLDLHRCIFAFVAALIFWFFPKFRNVVLYHSISNLFACL